jgi:hypothetical protein
MVVEERGKYTDQPRGGEYRVNPLFSRNGHA